MSDGVVRVAVVHETGDARAREERMARAFPDADLLVFGHSHIPWDTVAPGGLRLLNPGSPTDRRRQPHCTYLTFTLAEGRVADVVLHRLRAHRRPLRAAWHRYHRGCAGEDRPSRARGRSSQPARGRSKR